MYFEGLLRAHPSVVKAARVAGINRTDFYKQLKRVGITPPNGGGPRKWGNKAWQDLGSKP